jgi:hypothetical protein
LEVSGTFWKCSTNNLQAACISTNWESAFNFHFHYAGLSHRKYCSCEPKYTVCWNWVSMMKFIWVVQMYYVPSFNLVWWFLLFWPQERIKGFRCRLRKLWQWWGRQFQRPYAAELSDFGSLIILVMGVTVLQQAGRPLLFCCIVEGCLFTAWRICSKCRGCHSIPLGIDACISRGNLKWN